MDVRIIEFPATRVAAIEHRGAPALEHETARRLIAWRIANRLPPDRYATYGLHYTDPRTTPPAEHRVDLCVAPGSAGPEVAPNAHGVVAKTLPRTRCAVARHHGSRDDVSTASYLAEVWLPTSGEQVGDFPIFFHYVDVGPDVGEEDMITDVYLPLR
ncbi:MAG: GyrI-like domain-containing protein [Gemmatimonadaceae bacterium]|nr:GyrI-like domain-containing protein [Gemmatimonadaceae bacterium]